MESSIYITLETLKYLKKGGRITPAAAAIGTVLNLQQVLQIQGEKLDAYAKVRGKKQAKRVMVKAIKEDFENRFAKYVESGEMCLEMAYTGNREEAEEFKKEVEKEFPGMEIQMLRTHRSPTVPERSLPYRTWRTGSSMCQKSNSIKG